MGVISRALAIASILAGCAQAQPLRLLRTGLPEFAVPGTLGTQALAASGSDRTYTAGGIAYKVENANGQTSPTPLLAAHAFTVATRAGRDAQRFEVRYNEPAWIDYPGHTYVDRSELDGAISSASHIPRSTDTWVAYSLYLEPRVVSGAYPLGGSINQIHQQGSDIYGACCSPPWDLYLADSDASLVMEYRLGQSATPPTGNTIAPTVLWHSAPVVRGVWHAVVLHFYEDFATGGSGVIQMWYDGVQVADFAGPWGFNGTLDDYFKYGIYRGAGHSNEILAVRFANMEISRSSLLARVSAPRSPY